MKPLGGRGKKAPYQTMQMRVPIPLKPKLEGLIADYREKVLLGDDLPELDDDSSDEDDTDPSNEETIKSQAEMIQAYVSEIHFLKYKLDQLNPLTSLEEAKESARSILRAKKSASQAVIKLLTTIYQVEVTVEDLR
jgi:type I site-specific restriction-modification system R (restriction) subunit